MYAGLLERSSCILDTKSNTFLAYSIYAPALILDSGTRVYSTHAPPNIQGIPYVITSANADRIWMEKERTQYSSVQAVPAPMSLKHYYLTLRDLSNVELMMLTYA